MPYKDILIHLDDDKHCEQRTDVALALAKRHGARLKGVAFALNWPIPVYVGIEVPIDLGSAQQQVIDKSANAVIEQFHKASEDAGVEFDSEIITCNVSRAPARLAYHARHADLTFM